MAARSVTVRIARFLCLFLLACVLLTVILVGALRWIDPPTSAFIVREQMTQSFKVRHEWADWERISSSMKIAVIASEDQTFPEHHGFDLKSIDQALEERERGRVRGASTISQQVAKNLFLWGGRSWVRKGLEAYFTILIELLWSKERILEVYLNVAEFGRGVFGVQAASEIFFRKSAQRLTRHEAALLAAVLPNPKRLKANAPSRYVRSRQQWILGQMRGLGGSAVLKRLEDE